MTGSSCFSNRICCSCLGEPRLNGPPASSWAFASSSAIFFASSPLCVCQHLAVDQHAGFLHVEQYRDEGLLDVFVDGFQRWHFAELLPQGFVKLQRDVGVFGRVRRRGLEIDLVEGQLLWRLCRPRPRSGSSRWPR